MFSNLSKKYCTTLAIIKLSSANTFNLDKTKILSSGKDLPNDKSLDWLEFKAFADEKISETEKLKFVLGKLENIAGKGENAGYQHFLLFPQCFQKVSFSKLLKVRIVW